MQDKMIIKNIASESSQNVTKLKIWKDSMNQYFIHE